LLMVVVKSEMKSTMVNEWAVTCSASLLPKPLWWQLVS
jgi:hypothetical protein